MSESDYEMKFIDAYRADYMKARNLKEMASSNTVTAGMVFHNGKIS